MRKVAELDINECPKCGGEVKPHGSVMGQRRVICKDCGRTTMVDVFKDIPLKMPGKETATLFDYKRLGEYLISCLEGQEDLIKIPKKTEIFEGALEEEAVLLLGDIHAGKTNQFLDPCSGEMIVTYNQEKMVEEFNRLLDSIYGINYLLSHGYKIRKLNIFGVGDLVDNNLIYKGQQWFIEYGVGKQALVLVNLLTRFLEACLTMFDEVEFVTIGGNHGRLTQGREAHPAYNNFDYLVGKMVQMLFHDKPRIKVTVSDSWYWLQKIYEWKYFIHHGDTVYSWMSMPYYGIVRQSKARRIEMDYNIECIGHFHQTMEIPVSSKAITLVNGCWIEKEDFSWRKFGNYSRPEQWYFGVSPKRPRTWQFRLDLLHPKADWNGMEEKFTKGYEDITAI